MLSQFSTVGVTQMRSPHGSDEQTVERERRITSDLKVTVSGRRHVNRFVHQEKPTEREAGCPWMRLIDGMAMVSISRRFPVWERVSAIACFGVQTAAHCGRLSGEADRFR